MTIYSIPMILSSDERNGARNKSVDGSTFTIELDRPIIVPKEAHYCYIEVQSAQIWNTTPNIITGINDQITITINNDSRTLTLDQGLYSLRALNDELQRQLETLGSIFTSAIQLSSDTATSKVIIEYDNIDVEVDFTPERSIRDILGFESQVYSPQFGEGLFIKAPNIATFNSVDYYLIHTDLVNYGIRNNTDYDQTVAEVYIDVPVGSQILYRPFNMPKIAGMELIGSRRNRINCWLTDDFNRRVDTNGENWSFQITINYVL